jgi:hypothetical protein
LVSYFLVFYQSKKSLDSNILKTELTWILGIGLSFLFSWLILGENDSGKINE